MLFLCYPKCSTCQKARKWLDEHGIKYTERHIAEKNPTYDELKAWYQQSGRKGQILRSTPNTAPLICGACNTQPEGLLTTA